MDAEFTALATEIDRIGKATTFNGNKLLDGTFGKSTTDSDGVTTTNGGSFQVGANQGETIGLDLGGIKLTSAGRDATTGQLNSPVDTDPSTSPGIADSLVDYVAAVDAGTDANGAATPAVAAHYTMAADTINKVDAALKSVSTARGTLGAFQNRMEHTIANLGVAVENLSASESRIRDTDMAQEMTSFSKSQILSQAGTAMLAQANQSSQGVLSLLKG
jgi:flagellin